MMISIDVLNDEIRRILRECDIDPYRVYLFGSVARGEHSKNSDVDLLVVSDHYEGANLMERGELYLEWDYDVLPAPDLLCLSVSEFEERKDKDGNVVKTTVEEGIQLV